MGFVTRLAKSVAYALGVEVAWRRNSPRHTLLGLRRFPIRTILDVGANTGRFACHVADIFPDAKIYAFEPLPTAFQELQRRADGRSNVVVLNYALGDRTGAADFFWHTAHSASSSLLASTSLCGALYPFTRDQAKTTVPLTTLDSAVERMIGRLIPDVLIKLDVQGYEDRVIRGGRNTFLRAQACLVEVSIDRLYENQADFKELVSMLDELGYRYSGNLHQVLGAGGHVVYVDAMFVRDDRRSGWATTNGMTG